MKKAQLLFFYLFLLHQVFAQEIQTLPGTPTLRQIAPALTKSINNPPRIITVEEKMLRGMVWQAMENIPRNYPNKLHQLNGFYRMVSTENQKYTKLIEAAFTVQDGNYKAEVNRQNTKVYLKQLRHSHEMGQVDTTILAARNKVYQAWKRNNVQVSTPNYLYRIFRGNQIRIAHDVNTILGKDGKFTTGNTFKLKNKEVVNQDTLYHITFTDNFMPGTYGYLKINSKDFAIVEFYRTSTLFGDYMGTYHLKYRPLNGKYYPTFMQVIEPRIINLEVGGHQVDIHTAWIDTVLIQKFSKIKSKNQLDWSSDLYSLKLPYDPNFWSGYKMLQQYSLEPSMRASLEKEDSLEYQFRENTTKVK